MGLGGQRDKMDGGRDILSQRTFRGKPGSTSTLEAQLTS